MRLDALSKWATLSGQFSPLDYCRIIISETGFFKPLVNIIVSFGPSVNMMGS